MEKLEELGARIDALSVRERGAIMLAALALLYVVWDALLLQPLGAREAALSQAFAEVGKEIETFRRARAALIEQRRVDPNAENRRRVAQLEAQIEALNEELERAAHDLIPPEVMAKVLETVLTRSRDVRFVRLVGLGSGSLVAPAEAPEGGAAAPGREGAAVLGGAYKHGLKFEFEGGYLETLKVLRELESLPWGLFWESIELEVDAYPTARTAVTVFTLSWDRDWIGV